MATVRGMTPEAIRALLKKEIGDYQALSIAVNNAKGTSESAIREVQTIREDLKNMNFDFDTSEYDKAMKKLEQDMSDLNESLDKVAEESLARETKLTALELALNKDREKFNQEMLDMAKELEASKESLKKELTEATEKLANNLTEVGTNLSGELEKANKTLSDSLAKDLSKLNTDLKAAFGKDLKNLETRQNSKTSALDKDLKDYKSNTDSKMSTLLSEIDKAKAIADGFLQPGNLVWNPMALDNARDITVNNGKGVVEADYNTGRGPGKGAKVTKTADGAFYVNYGVSDIHGFELKTDYAFKLSAWVKADTAIPNRSFGIKTSYTGAVMSGTIPANTWTLLEGETVYKGSTDRNVTFELYFTDSFPKNASIIISEPYTRQKVTSDLIVDGAVQSKSLATGAVTAGKIAADAVTANNIAAGSVGADKIVANAIGADQLAANAVTADKIAANAVNADKIAAKAIGSDQLAANAVTAEKIAAKAIGADQLAAEAVTADKIASNAVTADKVAANSITAKHMVIAQPGNLIANGSLAADNAGWDSALTYRNTGQAIPPTGRYLITNSGQGTFSAHGEDKWFDVQPGASYAFEIWLYADKPNSVLYIECRNQDLKHAGTAGGAVNEGDLWTGGYVYLVNRRQLDTSWKRYSCVYTMGPDTTRARLGSFYFNHSAGSERNAQVAFAGVSMRPMADASLIVKGGIQSDHIATNAITSDHISVGSINGDRIAANTLDAGAIKAGSLTSDNVTIKDGAIKTAMIGDGQITNAKIKDLNASKINAGTINAARIGSNAITGDKIAAGTISGDHIQADSISVRQLTADAITRDGTSLIVSEPIGPNGEMQPLWSKIPGVNPFTDPKVDGETWYGTPGKVITGAPPKWVRIKIFKGVKYRLKFNIVSNKRGSVLFIEMRDQDGNHAVKGGAVDRNPVSTKAYTGSSSFIKQVVDFTPSESYSTTDDYLVNNYEVPTEPTRVTSLIEFKPDVTHVYLSRFYFNHSNGSTTDAYVRISDLTLEADILGMENVTKRLVANEKYTQRLSYNVGNLLQRATRRKADTVMMEQGTWGFQNDLGICVHAFRGEPVVHVYMHPEWKGDMVVTAIYQSGETKSYFYTHQDFKVYNTASTPKDPPSKNYQYYSKHSYCPMTKPSNDIKVFRFEIMTEITYADARGMVYYGELSGSYPVDLTAKTDPSLSRRNTPPWEMDWDTAH